MIRRKELVDPSVHVRDARLYVLVVEGAETEKAYFHSLEDRGIIPRSRVKIHVVSPDDHKSAPRYILNTAVKEKSSFKPYMPDDETWLVFDVDLRSGQNRLQQLHETLHDAELEKIEVALSNPCFEVWLLLHVHEDLTDVTDEGRTAEDKLRSLLGRYHKRVTPVECLSIDALQAAMTRARNRDIDPRSPLPSRPGTRVYRLMERLSSTQTA